MQQLILNLFWLMDSGIITCISSQLFFVWFSGRRWRGSLKKILYALLLRDYCNFWCLSSRTGWLAWMLCWWSVWAYASHSDFVVCFINTTTLTCYLFYWLTWIKYRETLTCALRALVVSVPKIEYLYWELCISFF
jgi:hypothetical protein